MERSINLIDEELAASYDILDVCTHRFTAAYNVYLDYERGDDTANKLIKVNDGYENIGLSGMYGLGLIIRRPLDDNESHNPNVAFYIKRLQTKEGSQVKRVRDEIAVTYDHEAYMTDGNQVLLERLSTEECYLLSCVMHKSKTCLFNIISS